MLASSNVRSRHRSRIFKNAVKRRYVTTIIVKTMYKANYDLITTVLKMQYLNQTNLT